MSDRTEYAKILRWYAPTSGVTGMKTSITIPSKYNSTNNVVIGGSRGNGFINFYIAADGADHHVECGLSTNWANQQVNWHYFWTDADKGSDGGNWVIAPGSTIPIELSINSSKTAIDFKVNGIIAKSFTGTFSSIPATLTQVRLVIAACDQMFVKKDSAGNVIPDTVPSPLPSWKTYHNQVICSNIQYRNTSNTWITCTSSNSTPPTTDLHWPVPSASHLHTGSPLNYIREVSAGQVIASLKTF